jgi:iron-sulfur cluster repair protein YtfE (RIC family)
MPNRIEEAASKIMGAAKAVKATLGNLHGVFKELEREHGEVTALLLRVRSSRDPAVARELFPKIRQELLSHEKGELTVVYPAFSEHAELAAYGVMHAREAEALGRLIEHLSATGYDDPQWHPTFVELVDAVAHHVKEEESDYFPVANRILGKQVAEELKIRFMAAKKTAMSEIVH